MKNTPITVLLAAVLSGCSDPADRVEGTYASIKQPWFGPPVTLFLVFKDDTAEMMSDKTRLKKTFHLDREGDRLILNDGPGRFGFVFRVEDDGKTLTCKSCGEVGFPDTWEYVGSDPETLTGRSWREAPERTAAKPAGLPFAEDLNRWSFRAPAQAGKKTRPTPKPKPTPSLLTRRVEGIFYGLAYDNPRKLPIRLSFLFKPYTDGVDKETATLTIEDPYGKQERTLILERGADDVIRLHAVPDEYKYRYAYKVVSDKDGNIRYLTEANGMSGSAYAEILLPESARHATRGGHPAGKRISLYDWPGLTPTDQVSGTFRNGSRRIHIDGDTMTFDYMIGVTYRFQLERGKIWILARPLDKDLEGSEFAIIAKENGRWLFIRKVKGPQTGGNALTVAWKKEGD